MHYVFHSFSDQEFKKVIDNLQNETADLKSLVLELNDKVDLMTMNTEEFQTTGSMEKGNLGIGVSDMMKIKSFHIVLIFG